jgi:hypothetical protein
MEYLTLEKLRVVEENYNFKGKNGKYPHVVEDIISLERFKELYCFDDNKLLDYYKKDFENNLFTGSAIGQGRYMKAWVHIENMLEVIKTFINLESDIGKTEYQWLIRWINEKLGLETAKNDSNKKHLFSLLDKLPDQYLFELIDTYLRIR